MQLTTNSSALELMDFVSRLDEFIFDENLSVLDAHPVITTCEDRSYSEEGTIFLQRSYIKNLKAYEELYVRIVITDSGASLDKATYFSKEKSVSKQDQKPYSDAFYEMLKNHFHFD